MARITTFINLSESPFQYTTDTGVTFYFSTALRMNKFVHSLHNNRVDFKARVLRKFLVNFECPAIADMYLYRTIEDKGFLVEYEGGRCTCPEEVRFTGKMESLKALKT